MARKKHSAEQIVAILRQIEVELANHKSIGQACKEALRTELDFSPPAMAKPSLVFTVGRWSPVIAVARSWRERRNLRQVLPSVRRDVGNCIAWTGSDFLGVLHVVCVYLAGLPLVLLHRLHTAAGNNGVVAGRCCFRDFRTSKVRLSALLQSRLALLGEENQHQERDSDDPDKADHKPGCLIVLGHAKTACCSYWRALAMDFMLSIIRFSSAWG